MDVIWEQRGKYQGKTEKQTPWVTGSGVGEGVAPVLLRFPSVSLNTQAPVTRETVKRDKMKMMRSVHYVGRPYFHVEQRWFCKNH